MDAHYHALAGLSGCMPNYSALHQTYSSAVEDLITMQELGRRRAAILRRNGYLDLNLKRDGNEYAEVVECWDKVCGEGTDEDVYFPGQTDEDSLLIVEGRALRPQKEKPDFVGMGFPPEKEEPK